MKKDRGQPEAEAEAEGNVGFACGRWTKRYDILTPFNRLSCTNRLMAKAALIPGQPHPTTSVISVPSAVEPVSTAMRIWNPAT
jgi:hypothetical protein